MYSLWRIGGLMGMAGGLLCLAGVAAAEPFAVELKNPSFDGAMAGRVPAGWSLYAGAGREQTFRLVEPAFGKGQAVLLDDRDAEHEIGLTQDVAAPGGQAYEVAVDVAAVPEAPPP
ncbi:MAG: hypothetical protein GX595_17505, partial [Lentisphaerae bacterium]|nr:hypothetical protein [Lentisphaerota bacterium]